MDSATGAAEMSNGHIYTAPMQKATRFRIDLGEHRRGHWIKFAPGQLLPTTCCEKRRPAKNLHVQIFYDSHNFFCRPGTGCKRK